MNSLLFVIFLIVVNISFYAAYRTLFDEEFEIFNQIYTNYTIANNSIFHEKNNSNESILALFSGRLWELSNSSIEYSHDLKVINLFKSKKSCKNELDWISQVNSNFSLTVRPIFLHELSDNENIRINCPQCSNKNKSYWYKINYKKNTTRLLKTNGHIRLIKDALHIQGFVFSDSGAYFCSTEQIEFDQIESKEILIIKFILLLKFPSEGFFQRYVIDKNNTELVNQTNGLREFYELPAESYVDNASELVIYTLWEEWSLCGNCGGKTLRNRLGDCRIMYNPSDNESKVEELNEIQRAYYPHGGSCQLGVYFKYLSEDILKMDIFNNYNQLEFCQEDCNSYENVLDEKAVNIFIKIS
jgi:hypothetical protein